MKIEPPVIGTLALFVLLLLAGCESLESREQEAIEYVRTGVDGLNTRALLQLCEYTTMGGYQRMTADNPDLKSQLDALCTARPRSWSAPP